MADKVILGAGSHEPIFHRIRTGHASAGEWLRWQRETTNENLDVLQAAGISRVLVACTKGFGFEAEKPLIERAAHLREECTRRGMQCDIYVQGLPVYYETFLLERPEAEQWMSRTQTGEFYPWGGQTFRRWMDQYCEEFLEYEKTLIRHAVLTVQPATVFLDNTVPPGISYTARSVEAFRRYLRDKYAGQDPIRLFGIPSFDKVDLPRYHDSYPPDAYRIVKDPLLQEVCHWQARTFAWWCGEIRQVVKDVQPNARYVIPCGCDTLRYNALLHPGIEYHQAILAADMTSQEESSWRPRVHIRRPSGQSQHHAIQDGRNPDAGQTEEHVSVRVATDARWTKILGNYGRKTGFAFWGEFEKTDQEIAAAHGMTFVSNAFDFGTVGPLAGHKNMTDNLKPMADWATAHLDLLDGRDERFCATAVWRSTATIGFVRQTPAWAACALEQMLFEKHLPFTILLDNNLDNWLTGRRALFLPMSSCIADEQAQMIIAFVRQGGGLVLIGDAGTRDERTRVRERHAFAELLPADALQQIEQAGPPHFVPEVNIGRLQEIIRAQYGAGRVSLVPRMTPVKPLDMTRDPYDPWRKVAVDDIVPPANEQEIWQEILWVMEAAPLRIEGPRHTLVEYWRQGEDMLIGCANLHPQADGGPITLHVPAERDAAAQVIQLYQDRPQTVMIRGGTLTLDSIARLAFIRIPGLMRSFGQDRRLTPA
jgi:hypothetical protein